VTLRAAGWVQTNLVEYLGNYVRAFAAQDAAAFNGTLAGLSTKQREAVQQVLTAR
jgi:serine/threonine protein kinase HipA of HipAB toxin-antitoxin module